MKSYTLLWVILLSFSCKTPFLSETDLTTDSASKLRIVQITDLHITKEKKLYENTISLINQIDPDLLFITGDTLESNNTLDLMEGYLSSITSDCLKYAVLGNWEYWGNVNIEDLESRYNLCGINLLVNDVDFVCIKDLEIGIFGLDDYLGGQPDFSFIETQQLAINFVLGHCPILFDQLGHSIESDNTYIMFSGHTHGGQITFFTHPLFLPQGSGDYVSGLYEKNGMTLYVSKGIGNSKVDFRLFSSPSLELFTF